MVFPESIGVGPSWGEQLAPPFFAGSPLVVAPELIGCVLASRTEGVLTAGRIVEVEAYLGSDDAGSHAATKGVTARNAVMYGPPGSAYVYFTYGNHYMLNLVCDREGVAGAVLVRALEPLVGLEQMARRRGRSRLEELCSGPGKLAQALGIDLSDNATMLGVGRVAVYAGTRSGRGEIVSSGRIGLREGHELPYRFYESDSRWVSRARTGRAPSGRKAAEGDAT